MTGASFCLDCSTDGVSETTTFSKKGELFTAEGLGTTGLKRAQESSNIIAEKKHNHLVINTILTCTFILNGVENHFDVFVYNLRNLTSYVVIIHAKFLPPSCTYPVFTS